MINNIVECWYLPEIKECHICINTENDTKLYECEKCGELYCYKCSASFTIHSQIDYNCCEQCANTSYE